MRRPHLLLLLAFALAVVDDASARSLAVYCSHDPDACELAAQTFQRETGIETAITRKPTGEFYAQIRAERANPKADVWYGGTIDPFLQAASEGLFVAYRSPRVAELQPWARRVTERSDYKVAAIYRIIIGFGSSATVVKQNELVAPRCWSDLLLPAYRKEIELANQLAGFDVTITIPCEGTGDALGGMAIIDGAPHSDEARAFYDWALTRAAQELANRTQNLLVPAHPKAEMRAEAAAFAGIKMLDVDPAKFGNPDERRRLLSRWQRESG